MRPVGWRYDSARHSLAAKGIRTRGYYAVGSLESVVRVVREAAPKALPVANVGLAATRTFTKQEAKPSLQIPASVFKQMAGVQEPVVPPMFPPVLPKVIPGPGSTQITAGIPLQKLPDDTFVPVTAMGAGGSAMGGRGGAM